MSCELENQNQEYGARYERGPLLDHCGIVVMYCPTSDIIAFESGLSGLKQLQTRGYDGAGVWARTTGGDELCVKGEGTIGDVFHDNIRTQFSSAKASLWMFQVRYGTNGGFHSDNVQPFVRKFLESEEHFCVVHNGEFLGYPEENESDTVRFADFLSRLRGANFDESLVKALRLQKGAWSLGVGTGDGLYLARDPYGIRPLVYGSYTNEAGNKVWAAASETSALQAMGVAKFFEVLPGQILKVNKQGVRVLTEHDRRVPLAACIFETVYIHAGESAAHAPRHDINTIQSASSTDDIRKKSGYILAREYPPPVAADVVIGIPGTGIAGGMAYSEKLGIPYGQYIWDRTPQDDQRTFMSADVDGILQKVLNHFNFNVVKLRGKRIVLVDDSMVRGNIMKGLIKLLKETYGVLEVHVRILSPKIDKGCYLGVNTRRDDLLIARRHENNADDICYEIGANSLGYLSPSGLLEAVGADDYQESGYCLGCMEGHVPPFDRNGVVYNNKIRLTLMC
jgi:amidophosphoribosyltransferase